MDFVNEGKEQVSLSNESTIFYLQMLQEQMRRADIAQTLIPISEDVTKLFFYGIAGQKEDNKNNLDSFKATKL